LGQRHTSLISDIVERTPKCIFKTDVCLASSDHDRPFHDLSSRLSAPTPYPKLSIKCRNLGVQLIELLSCFREITDAIFGRGRRQMIENDFPMIASLEQYETLLKKSSSALRV